MFLQSIREGKEKFTSEHYKGIDSAAGNFNFLVLRQTLFSVSVYYDLSFKIKVQMVTIYIFMSTAYINPSLKVDPKIKVKKVFRVQNKHNEEKFGLHLQHLAGDESENVDKIIHERVYHGTGEIAFKIVSGGGFNRSKTVAYAYGNGAYFARYGQLGAHHALNKGRRTGYIIACKMASTKIGTTMPNSTEPNDGCDCGGSGDDYDSWMRVSYNDSQVCPEYILEIELDYA